MGSRVEGMQVAWQEDGGTASHRFEISSMQNLDKASGELNSHLPEHAQGAWGIFPPAPFLGTLPFQATLNPLASPPLHSSKCHGGLPSVITQRGSEAFQQNQKGKQPPQELLSHRGRSTSDYVGPQQQRQHAQSSDGRSNGTSGGTHMLEDWMELVEKLQIINK